MTGRPFQLVFAVQKSSFFNRGLFFTTSKSPFLLSNSANFTRKDNEKSKLNLSLSQRLLSSGRLSLNPEAVLPEALLDPKQVATQPKYEVSNTSDRTPTNESHFERHEESDGDCYASLRQV